MVYKPKDRQLSEIVITPNPWEMRERGRNQILSEYLNSYVKMPFFTQAVVEGWSVELWTYVRAVANVQAQMIIPGGSGIGFDGFVIFGPQSKPEQRRLFMYDQQMQADTGQIDVPIPTGKIEEWKRGADWEKRFNQEPAIANKAKRIDNPAINAEIQRQLQQRLGA